MDTVGERRQTRARKSGTVLRHRELHDRLLAEAEAAIVAAGLDSLRARTLAEAVGCSVGAIYGVFPDLDALVLAVNARTLDEVDAAMQAVRGGAPAQHLVRLAEGYLDYAAGHRARWQALFQYRLPPNRAIPPDYAAREAAAFSHIEAPLTALCPDLAVADCAMLARTMFSAVHGMVTLGLDEKVASMPMDVLRGQIRTVVQAMAKGLRA